MHLLPWLQTLIFISVVEVVSRQGTLISPLLHILNPRDLCFHYGSMVYKQTFIRKK